MKNCGEKTFLVGVWLEEGGKNVVGPGCFLPSPTKMFSPAHGFHPVASPSFLFFGFVQLHFRFFVLFFFPLFFFLLLFFFPLFYLVLLCFFFFFLTHLSLACAI